MHETMSDFISRLKFDKKAFEGFASYVVRSIAMRNANMGSESIAAKV